jgi:hypothetical protein
VRVGPETVCKGGERVLRMRVRVGTALRVIARLRRAQQTGERALQTGKTAGGVLRVKVRAGTVRRRGVRAVTVRKGSRASLWVILRVSLRVSQTSL